MKKHLLASLFVVLAVVGLRAAKRLTLPVVVDKPFESVELTRTVFHAATQTVTKTVCDTSFGTQVNCRSVTTPGNPAWTETVAAGIRASGEFFLPISEQGRKDVPAGVKGFVLSVRCETGVLRECNVTPAGQHLIEVEDTDQLKNVWFLYANGYDKKGAPKYVKVKWDVVQVRPVTE